MRLIYHPIPQEQAEQFEIVPPALKNVIAPWAKVNHRSYEEGTILTQELLSRKFNIHIWRVDARKPMNLFTVCDESTIILHFNLANNYCDFFKGYGGQRLSRLKSSLFYVTPGISEIVCNPGLSESLFIEIDADLVEDIADVDRDTRELLAKLNADNGIDSNIQAVHITYISQIVLKSMRHCEKKNGALILEMKKFIFELLSEYVAGIKNEEEDAGLQYVAYKETLIRVKQYILLSPSVREQTLKKLSRQFTISEGILKKNFKALFHITPSAFVRSQALGKAHYLVTTTSRSIDDIADETGYSGANNLYPAFMSQYGCSPAELRKVH